VAAANLSKGFAMPRLTHTPKLDGYLTVGRAAELLGVSPWTLRHWDRAGKLTPPVTR